MAVLLHNTPGNETVLRGGGGLFYDTGQNIVGQAGEGHGLGSSITQEFGSAVGLPTQGVPLPAGAFNAQIPAIPQAPYSISLAPSPNYFPPSAIQWNVSLEQALGQNQSLTVGYVGSQGRNLQVLRDYSIGNVNPLFSSIEQYENGPGSSYNSLQIQYKRKLSRGLQVLASHTWSHAIDSVSIGYSDLGILPEQRGNADFDVRNNFNAAVTYDLPSTYNNRLLREVLGYWGMDLRFTSRGGFPVEIEGPSVLDPATGNEEPSSLNYSGANPYVHVAGIPGGREFNPAVFSVPANGQIGHSPRNFLRGFGDTEANLAIRRNFALYEHLNLQFRAEAFNITNHPNFGYVNDTCGTSTPGAACTNTLMGQATNTLSNALGGFGNLGALYQQGGPRSMQFALKLQF
jgi:hypothetical protein